MSSSPGSTPKRVLHVMRIKTVGGAENHLLQLVPQLAHRGWESDVLIPSPDPEHISGLVRRFAQVCRRVTVLPMPRDLSPALLARLVRLMRSGEYDLVHAHLVHADWYVALASLAAPRPMRISTKHNHDRFREAAPFKAVESLAANRYGAIIAISDSLHDFTRRWTRLRSPLVTVHYGLEAPPQAPESRPGGAAPTLLTVARLVPQKGLDVLVRAMAVITKSHPKARLLIAGEGAERPRLEKLIASLELSESVRLLGLRTDVPELMRSAWMMVHPARFEGFGLVFLEAMREGLPIVATRVGAVPEVVVDGRTGVLVEPEDPQALADGVLQLLGDPEFMERAGGEGFSRLRESYSPERMGDATAGLYDRLVSGTI